MKRKEKLNKEILEPKIELKKLFYIFLGIAIIFTIFYGIAYLKLNNKKANNDSISSTIQYEKILFANILDQNSSHYYVLSYLNSEYYEKLYTTYTTKYKNVENSLSIYIVNMNDSFNKSFISSTTSLNKTKIINSKISDDIIFEIKEGKISSYYIGKEKIEEFLKSIVK